jgi:hypothetical protein
MRIKPGFWLASLAGLSVLAVSIAAGAAVVWTSTFEKGDLSEWGTPNNRTRTLPDGTVRTNIEVVGDHVYSGKYACKLTVHPDDIFPSYNQNRVDMGHQSGMLTREGSDSWISGHYMMLADAGMRNEFAFWESNSSYQNVMDFWVEPKTGGGTTIGFGVGLLGMTKVWTGDFAIGKWHQVAMHVHWSTSVQMGSIDVWFDGQQVVTAYKYNTKPDMNTLFFQTGLHRRNPPPAGMNIVDTIYFDDFVEADSLADVAIAAPIQPGGDGGAASEAGADGGAGDGGAGAGATDASNAGSGVATSGAGAMSGATSSTGTTGASGTLGSSGTSAAAGGNNGGAAGATSGVAAAATGTGGGAASGSSSGCGLSNTRTPSAPVVSVLALMGIAFARRRRRG